MGHRLGELARLVGGRVKGDPDLPIDGLATLETAGPRDLSFVTGAKYRRQAAASSAGALLVGPEIELDRDLLVSEAPYFALARLLEHFHPERAIEPGLHPTAVVGDGCRVDPLAAVGAYCVVGEGSSIEAGAVLHPHVVVGRDCRIGSGTVLHPQAVLYDGTLLGARCVVHAGVVLGSDGFGFATHEGAHHKLRQVGRVVVEDDVEIGANCTVDRAMLDETRLGAGSKLDNLVHIGHNVRIGPHSLLVAQVGISGSTRLGAGVVIGGQSGVAGHLRVGDRAKVWSKSAVFQSLPPGSEVAGIPAVDVRAWRRQQALVRRLADLLRRLRRLESGTKSADSEENGD